MGVRKGTEKGKELEIEVATLLQRAGFEVNLDSKSAKPRQTDIFAKSKDFDLIVEVKNQKRKVDIDDIDALRSRLGRVSSDIVGVIFTSSSLSAGAIKEIEANRSREILAIIGAELDDVRSGRKNLSNLIHRKREQIRENGKSWFSSKDQFEFVRSKLPLGELEFEIGAQRSSWFESKSNFASMAYAPNIPDTGWVISGEGARLSLRLELSSFDALRDTLGYLHAKFGLSNEGAFSIHQSESCWHGVGAESFLHSLRNWTSRYQNSSAKKFHHSEEAFYFDSLLTGWVELSLQQRVDFDDPNSAFFHHVELTVQLSGIPVDLEPFVRLCRYTGNEWASFEYVQERLTKTVRLKKAIALQMRGTIIGKALPSRDDDEFIVGLIVKNPFFKRKKLPKELDRSDYPIPLHDDELIPCFLRHHHLRNQRIKEYQLTGFEFTLAGRSIVAKPIADWR